MIVHSASEARRIGAPLVRLWAVGLARRPSAAELQAAAARLRAGDDLADAALAMADSAEFHSRHGPPGPPDRNYLRALFWAADGQDAPDAEVARLLSLAATRGSLLAIVSQSPAATAAIGVAEGLYPGGLPPNDDVAYALWLDGGGEPSPPAGPDPALTIPALTVVLTVSPARPDLLRQTVASLAAQSSPGWQAVLVRHTAGGRTWPVAEALAAADPRLQLLDAAGATPAAALDQAAALATGELIGFIDAGDQLAPGLCGAAGALLAARPGLVLAYTDEDRVDGDGTRSAAMLKPGWGADMLLSGNAIGQLALYRRTAVLAAGLNPAAGPHLLYALSLAVTADPAAEVAHLPGILFHRGRAHTGRPPPFPTLRASNGDATLNAVLDAHLAQHRPGLHRGQRRAGARMWPTLTAALPSRPPRVSVIMPTRDRAALLETSTAGLLEATDYPDLELLVVDNGSTQPAALALLRRLAADPRVRVIDAPGPFNWSALNNLAAAQATGDVLVLLNNDVSMPDPGWLRAMAGQAIRPQIGVVGARLLFPDGTLQHGGVLLSPRGAAVHALTGAAADEPGYGAQVAVLRDLSAVTGACLATRRAVFQEVGGLEANALQVAWSDIELCLRVRAAGYRVVWDPAITLVHHEMATRGRDVSLAQQARHGVERGWVRARWPGPMEHDPFLNPALRATAYDAALPDVAAGIILAPIEDTPPETPA